VVATVLLGMSVTIPFGMAHIGKFQVLVYFATRVFGLFSRESLSYNNFDVRLLLVSGANTQTTLFGKYSRHQ